MQWVEIIRLRMHQGIEKEVKDLLTAVIADIHGVPGLVKVDSYRNSAVPTDLSLHLSWSGQAIELHGSRLGLSIAENLKNFGLLDHSIWVREGTEAEAM